jgi:hypothetical protein
MIQQRDGKYKIRMSTQRNRTLRKIAGLLGAVTAVTLDLLLPPDQREIYDNALEIVFFALLVGGGAWALFWWVRIRRWRRRQALRNAQK